MKCALQEFQHVYPQLTARIRDLNPETSGSTSGSATASGASHQPKPHFVPMECPTFPLDTEFKCRDMLHDKFDTENGPLWRVQLVTEATMEKANLGNLSTYVLPSFNNKATNFRPFNIV